MYSSVSQLIYRFQIFREHIRMLVILCGDVLFDRIGKGDIMGAPKGNEQYVAAITLALVVISSFCILTKTSWSIERLALIAVQATCEYGEGERHIAETAGRRPLAWQTTSPPSAASRG